MEKKASLSYIFLTFLKLGATAFGGYMTLVAIVQKQVVDVDKKLTEEDLLDGVSLTSVLPGPVAVNTIAYVGYRLRGITGAIAAFAGIIIPSFALVIALSWFYFTHSDVPIVKNVFNGITPAIIALIITVGAGMAKKTIKNLPQIIVCVIAAAALIFIGGFLTTFLLIILSGILGWILFHKSTGTDNGLTQTAKLSRRQLIVSSIIALLLLSTLIWGGSNPNLPLHLQILSTFSGISLTLFGGGYVVIPALSELFVNNLQWLTPQQFADGIAIGQITPGPIFITATFIGYKVAGIFGATLATIAIFVPPAILTVLLSHFIATINNSSAVKAAMKGIRSAVIGMIFASAVTIGQTATISIAALIIFLLVLFISYKYKISPVYLILGSGIAGLIFC